MARQKRHGFLMGCMAPLVAGSALTAAALLWLSGDAEREDLAKARPTILDFGRLPSPPVLRQPLADKAPPPVEVVLGRFGGETPSPPDLPPPPPAPASFEGLFPRVTVLDAVRFRAIRDRETLVIHLAGVAGIAFSDTCEGTAGRWNCGARARADLARLIGPRSVGCVGIGAAGEDGESAADCWVGGRNLSLFMVSRGWAEPIDPADPLLAPYAAKAKEEKLGRFGDGGVETLGE
ncbi:thermonuclease family protein [Pleomorphomonas sp. NRK KF1]|uniref:thermonuclease family protein n=1 Tax=Pleomorphomonas sp. NRK KF1 TaxID=2943000 RepID=UPI002044693D|nr:thermonuclease family protein [Pleomorphomonas sp. NRK KF1]MCM5553755.1 thermonuclease family protein [Pleomorphomonas sp. NRK KF1]